MAIKTLAMKVLEGRKIAYETAAYEVDSRDAIVIASELNVPAGQVFKTLVVLPPKGQRPSAKPLLVMVPADRQLDLKSLAKAVGTKKLKMAAHQDAERLTGLQVGGISALALLNKGFAVYLDSSAQSYEQIFVSAGQRGLQIKLAVGDLIKVTKARVTAVSE